MKYFIAIGLPFLILMIFGHFVIKILKRLNFGQQIRGEGPKSHYNKQGIPTMGGILLLIGISISAIFYLKVDSLALIALVITLAMGLLGFMDDYKKIKTGRSLGLRAREKLLGQILVALILSLYIYFYSDIGTGIIIPFTGNIIILKQLIIPFIIITVVGTANAVNLTDGLDGLAAGITAVVSSSFAILSTTMHLEGLTFFNLSITGACLGFIWFNSHPAQVFMGDVGSLALGGAVAAVAVLTRTELFLFIIGGVYVLETLSVMIQVSYFKLTGGKRVFRMTPIHHHYELKGLEEEKVVARFLLLSLIFAIIGLFSYYFYI